MFDFRVFVMNTIKAMIQAGEPDYRVMQYAAKYYEQGVLQDDDMEEIQRLLDERRPQPEPEPEPEPEIDE